MHPPTVRPTWLSRPTAVARAVQVSAFIALFSLLGYHYITQSRAASLPAASGKDEATGSFNAAPHAAVKNDNAIHYVPGQHQGGADYYYAGGAQYVSATGVAVMMDQAQPVLPPGGGASSTHSLMELAAESADGKQIVEVGWTVDRALNGDALPHLFVYHWNDGQTSCYNTCGFVQTSSHIRPGQPVLTGQAGNYGVIYTGGPAGKWSVRYNGEEIGYYPKSAFSTDYSRIGLVQVFGEVSVAASAANRCVPMGNGRPAADPLATAISRYQLTGDSQAPALEPYQTPTSAYTYDGATSTGLRLGGSGQC